MPSRLAVDMAGGLRAEKAFTGSEACPRYLFAPGYQHGDDFLQHFVGETSRGNFIDAVLWHLAI
jgi:hypothetical protein